jgi:hypothetical protein
MWTASFQVDHGGQYEFTSPSDNHDGTMLKLGVSSPELVNFINSQQRAFARSKRQNSSRSYISGSCIPTKRKLVIIGTTYTGTDSLIKIQLAHGIQTMR